MQGNGSSELEKEMRYWDNICKIQARQTAKGIKTYGRTLEANHDLNLVEWLTMREEEMIDDLMYTEKVKEEAMEFLEWQKMKQQTEDDGK